MVGIEGDGERPAASAVGDSASVIGEETRAIGGRLSAIGRLTGQLYFFQDRPDVGRPCDPAHREPTTDYRQPPRNVPSCRGFV